jgi:hypothetical protein
MEMTTRRDALRSLTAIGLGITLAPLPRALRAQTASVVKQGSFTGQSKHVASGSVAIITQDGKSYVSLGRDFDFDGGPDPKVALGKGGYRSDTILGVLQSNSGAQSYPLPERLNGEEFDQIWIWCEQYDVPLGLAHIK